MLLLGFFLVMGRKRVSQEFSLISFNCSWGHFFTIATFVLCRRFPHCMTPDGKEYTTHPCTAVPQGEKDITIGCQEEKVRCLQQHFCDRLLIGSTLLRFTFVWNGSAVQYDGVAGR